LEAYQPISLGSFCEAKFQACRKLYTSFYGKTSETGFRIQMMPPERGARQYDTHPFDWQRVSFPRMLEWLESDFEGVLEREDLRVEGNFILHSSGSEHSHLFPGFTAGWTEENLDKGYPVVRRAFDRRVAHFRTLLTRPGPYLYMWTASSTYPGTDMAPSLDEVRRLIGLLGAASADHRLHVLIVTNPGKSDDYSSLKETVSQALRTDETGKSPTMAWEGNDTVWQQQILAPFALTLHDREPPTVAAPPPAPQPSPHRGLFARMLKR
jgi:hypothetical protein